MTRGLSAGMGTSRLNVYRGTSHAGIATYWKLHTGDPGAAGTANASAVTTRNAATFAAPAGMTMSLTALASYAMTATETITDISAWDAPTAGNFQESLQLASPVPVINGSTLNITGITLSEGPAAS